MEQRARPPLYPGEVVETIVGFPTIYHYQPGIRLGERDERKPLIICVTGG